MSSFVMMSSLAVLPSAMLAKMHSVWQIRKVVLHQHCYLNILFFVIQKKSLSNVLPVLQIPLVQLITDWSQADVLSLCLWNVKTSLQCGFKTICKHESTGEPTCSLTSILCSASRMRVTACMICFPWELMIWSMCWWYDKSWVERKQERISMHAVF